MKQLEYIKKIADINYERFYKQGFATAGHNGPHGHLDTPVRNTAHYLIIYSFFYKITKENRYINICKLFVDYLITEQSKSKSGAIECMKNDRFDHLNGLIGQGWVIESLIYYFQVSNDKRCIDIALKIFYSQKYNYEKHLWDRIELNGENIGIDPTYNHNIWFAACAYKLNDYCKDNEVDRIIIDLLTYGANRDFQVYNDGLLHHYVNLPNDMYVIKAKCKSLIKYLLSPFCFINQQKLEPHYMEYAYHVFDMYGFSVLKEKYEYLPLFSSKKFYKAMSLAANIMYINNKCGIKNDGKEQGSFNVFSYSYNSPAFEWPYVSKILGFENKYINDELYSIQESLMLDVYTGLFTKNNPDIELWNARTYEFIRYIENVDL